jgi:hypothetical protein
MGGARRFVRILQLLGEHPMPRVSQAIEACHHDHLYTVEAVIQRTQSLAAIEAARRDGAAHQAEDTLPRVEVPVPDLRCFNQLLSPRTEESPVSIFFA